MSLKTEVAKKALSLRIQYTSADPFKPRFIESDYYKLGNKIYSRLRIILRSNGCSIPTCTMCPFPNETLDPEHMLVTPEHYIQQVRSSLSKYSMHDIISIYNDGSFFANIELSKATRIEIYKLIKKYYCKYLMVESLPRFITQECLEDASSILKNDIGMIVGIGFQSITDEIREICIGADIKRADFLRANALLKKFNYEAKCYIMFKPPFLLEQEAITEALESTIWLYNHSIRDITLCPTRVAKNTVLQCLFDKYLYSIPKLTSFVELLARLQALKIQVRLSLFNVSSSDFNALTPSGCLACNDKILNGLIAYNDMKKVNFRELICPYCSEQAEKDDPEEFKKLKYLDRVRLWLDIENN